MLIINADDWGGWESATDAALACYKKGRITSVTAMVFMADSERGAALARDAGLDAGLHLNLDAPFTGGTCPEGLRRQHLSVCRWLRTSRYSQLIYNPFLGKHFRCLYQAQINEFERLYGYHPSHIDGHHHLHLCANVLVDGVIPCNEKIRRGFSFWPGEKSFLKRAYRGVQHKRLAARYRTTDHFFSLAQCVGSPRLARVEELARISAVELMTHPENPGEFQWLMSEEARMFASRLQLCNYSRL